MWSDTDRTGVPEDERGCFKSFISPPRAELFRWETTYARWRSVSSRASQDLVVLGRKNTRSSVTIRKSSDLIHNGSATDPRVIREFSAAFTQVIRKRFHRFST